MTYTSTADMISSKILILVLKSPLVIPLDYLFYNSCENNTNNMIKQ